MLLSQSRVEELLAAQLEKHRIKNYAFYGSAFNSSDVYEKSVVDIDFCVLNEDSNYDRILNFIKDTASVFSKMFEVRVLYGPYQGPYKPKIHFEKTVFLHINAYTEKSFLSRHPFLKWSIYNSKTKKGFFENLKGRIKKPEKEDLLNINSKSISYFHNCLKDSYFVLPRLRLKRGEVVYLKIDSNNRLFESFISYSFLSSISNHLTVLGNKLENGNKKYLMDYYMSNVLRTPEIEIMSYWINRHTPPDYFTSKDIRCIAIGSLKSIMDVVI